jgi:hypothetical protein
MLDCRVYLLCPYEISKKSVYNVDNSVDNLTIVRILSE